MTNEINDNENVNDKNNNDIDFNSNKRKRRLYKIIIVGVVIFIIIGLFAHLILIYMAASSLEIANKKITGVKPLSNSFDDYEITFKIILRNPSNTEILIEKLTYEAYLEGDFIGDGEKIDFTIEPGSKEYTFKLQFNVFNLGLSVRNLFLSSSATLTIEGSVTVPVNFLGILKVSEITLDYEIVKDVKG